MPLTFHLLLRTFVTAVHCLRLAISFLYISVRRDIMLDATANNGAGTQWKRDAVIDSEHAQPNPRVIFLCIRERRQRAGKQQLVEPEESCTN